MIVKGTKPHFPTTWRTQCGTIRAILALRFIAPESRNETNQFGELTCAFVERRRTGSCSGCRPLWSWLAGNRWLCDSHPKRASQFLRRATSDGLYCADSSKRLPKAQVHKSRLVLRRARNSDVQPRQMRMLLWVPLKKSTKILLTTENLFSPTGCPGALLDTGADVRRGGVRALSPC
jgi:hypothetical protein